MTKQFGYAEECVLRTQKIVGQALVAAILPGMRTKHCYTMMHKRMRDGPLGGV